MADGGSKSELIGDLLQDEKQAEDGALEQFLKRESVQFTAEETAELRTLAGRFTRRLPGR